MNFHNGVTKRMNTWKCACNNEYNQAVNPTRMNEYVSMNATSILLLEYLNPLSHLKKFFSSDTTTSKLFRLWNFTHAGLLLQRHLVMVDEDLHIYI